MKQFKFRKRELELNIEGRKYFILCDDKLAEKLQMLKKQYYEFADIEKISDKPILEIIEVCKGIIDGILGKPAFDDIFKNRKVDAHDAIDVVVFLMDSIAEKYREQKPVLISAQKAEKTSGATLLQ